MILTIDTATTRFWGKVLCISLIALGWLYILYAQYIHPQDGEHVLVTPENTKTTRDKVIRLAEIAVFPSHVVRWHIFYFSSVVGGLISLLLLNYIPTRSFLGTYLCIIIPNFLVGQIAVNFQSYHGPARKHAELARELRSDLLYNLSGATDQ